MKIACVQLCSGTDMDANIEQASQCIRAAHARGAQFIATPENTHLMQSNTEALFARIKPEETCSAVSHFKALAKELSIDLLIGSLAIKIEDRKAANRSFLFGSDGQTKARYDKIHMFDVEINAVESWRESANYRAGNTPVITPVGQFNVGMSICYDLRFADLYKYYAQSGAHILTIPAAFTAVTGKAHWEVLLRARAIETSSYVVAPAQGGHHENGRETWGRSMIINPWGEIIAHMDDASPGFCMADVSMEAVASARQKIPAWQNETQLP